MSENSSAVTRNPITGLTRMGRNVLILSVCQALGLSGVALVFLAGGILGAEMAPSASWSTLPVAFEMVGMALFTVPAALIMKRIGRKRGFVLAALVAALAALGAAYAISLHNFFFFCGMLLIIGANIAFIQQYRFAATESVAAKYTGRAVSYVLIGGIVAGFLGPEIGRLGRDWLGYGAYSGSFVMVAILYTVSVVVLLFLRNTAVKEDETMAPTRPLKEIVRQRPYLVAAFTTAVAFGVMGFVMSATPLSMHVIDSFNLRDTTIAIQGHIIAMYLPSLFTAFLVERLGLKVLQITGIAILVAGVIVAVSGHGFVNYIIVLICLGLGWNFLFVSGTVLLTRSYRPSERFKAQGVNDFAIFTFQALVMLSAGAVLTAANWEVLNLICLPFLLLVLVLVLTGRSKQAAPAVK